MATVTPPPAVWNRVEVDRRVRHPLQSLRGYIRLYVSLEGAAIALCYLALWFWVSLALDYGAFALLGFDWIQELQSIDEAGQPTSWAFRLALLLLLLLGLLSVAALKIVWRLGKEFRDQALALVLERRFVRQLGDRLITAVEMADPKLAQKYGFSQALIDQTIRDAADRVESVPVRGVFNWRRLYWWWWAVGFLTVGLYVLVGVVTCLGAAATGGNGSPLHFLGQFHNVAGIWGERHLLLLDTYWPRNAYLEIVRFQGSQHRPNEMRVGRDEHRPDVQVRAYQWVVADTRVAGGWRPLRWQDLDQFLDRALLQQCALPPDWGQWIIDLDELAASVPNGVLPADWQGKTSGVLRREAQKPASRQAIASVQAEQAVEDLLDWRTWTVDRLAKQEEEGEVRRALRDQLPQAHQALVEVMARLQDLAERPSMARRLRQLEIPDQVHVYYRGKTTKQSATYNRQVDHNKYAIGLNELKESVRFTVRARDFYTPYKNIELVPPPSLASLSIDKEEPAYIYYRLQGDQKPLQGLKQQFRDLPISVTGDISSIQVPIGTNLTLRARADRQLKGGVRLKAPANQEERGSVVPGVPVLFGSPAGLVGQLPPDWDGQTFGLQLSRIDKNLEFNFEFNDLDNVKGSRRILIRPVDDRAPEVLDVELAAVLRKPRFKADPGKSSQGTAADGFLITPDALLPFKGTLRDDHGLTRVDWVYEVEPVRIELVGQADPSKEKLPTLVLGSDGRLQRPALWISGLQFGPGHTALPWLAPHYWIWMTRVLEVDLALAARREPEKTVLLRRFQERLLERAAQELPLNAVLEKLKQKPSPANHLTIHLLKEEAGFDLKQQLPALKVKDATKEAQLHYLLRLSVAAADNNVDTGPGVGRTKAPFSFLVVSETELLAQVFFEEEALRERLEKAVFKLKNGKTSIEEQISKLAKWAPGQADTLSLIGIRVDEVRKALLDAGSATREVYADYSRILRELEVNRVGFDTGKKKIDDVDSKICRPLEDITNPSGGNFTVTEEAFLKLSESLETLAGLPQADDSIKTAHQARDHLNRLIERLDQVLLAMDEGIAWGKLLEIIVTIEQGQRRAAEQVRGLHDEEVRKILDLISDPAPKKKS